MGHGFIYINLSICPPIFSPFIKNGRFLPVPCHNQEQFFYQYLNSLSYDSSSYLLNYSPLLQKVNWTFYQQCSQLFPYWFRIHPDMNITPKTNYLVNAGQENRTENQVFEKKEQKKMVLVRRNVHFKASNEYPPDVAASLQSGVESSSYVEVSNKQEKDLIEAVRNRRKAIKKCLR
ncbi:MAG TPA: hypothetical protein VEY51_12500, partial [Chondromyces sp.]|nr:hypothetical protein [Chondromyces sp.]